MKAKGLFRLPSTLIPYSTLTAIFLIFLVVVSAGAQNASPVFVLEDMDEDLIIGQRALNEWGFFWSAPAVTGINLGYLAEHGYPNFVPDSNGDGDIDSEDLVGLVDTLGWEEYMKTDPDRGTTDPDLLYGLAKYVDETYPETFIIKVYERDFRSEYLEVMGEGLGEELFGVPIRVFPDPRFASYERELREGEMVWVGVPQENTDLNHFLAGRSFDTRPNFSGNFPVDFGDPRERAFDPGKGQIIETQWIPPRRLEYEGPNRPVDILIALSPLEEIEEDEGQDDEEQVSTGGPNLVCETDCEYDCEKKTERVCVDTDTVGGGCLDWYCEGQSYTPSPGAACDGELKDGICCTRQWICLESEEGTEQCTEYETRVVTDCSAECRFTVTNIGDEAALPHTDEVVVVLGGPRCQYPGDTRKLWWPDMAAGDSESALLNFEAGPGCSVAQVTCRVDIFGAVDETNEGDNENSQTYE